MNGSLQYAIWEQGIFIRVPKNLHAYSITNFGGIVNGIFTKSNRVRLSEKVNRLDF